MKLDEDVKMISAEAPLLFAKAAEIFIHELTLRAWIHTENNKRRTLQRNDIAMAITKFDQFDFLIDIVPREEIKPTRKETQNKSIVNCDQVQYYLQLAQQHQQALQGTSNSSNSITNVSAANITNATTNSLNPVTLPNTIQLPTGQLGAPLQINTNGTPQNILVTNTGQPITSTAVMNNLGRFLLNFNFFCMSLISVFLVVLFFRWTTSTSTTTKCTNSVGAANCWTKWGISNNASKYFNSNYSFYRIEFVLLTQINVTLFCFQISIPQNQLNLIRMQVQNQANSQPIIISTNSLTNQPQILQMAQSPQTGVYLTQNTNDE